MPKIRLKVAVKTRDGRIVVPGVYDTEDENFPACLVGVDQETIVEILPELPVSEPEVEEEEGEEEEEEEVAEDASEMSSDTPKKKKKKKRG